MAEGLDPHDKSWQIPIGTQVVVARAALDASENVVHPAGATGVVVAALGAADGLYRVRFLDHFEAVLERAELSLPKHFKQRPEAGALPALQERVIYRCIVGSRAFGLDNEESDTDRRGIYLPTAEQHWSLYGVPEQLENDATQEAYWELQKFLVMALKANPNVLECLYSPLVETQTPLATELLALRECFLSQLVYQTFSGYVMSQFKKLSGDLRNHGQVKWKHVMHLLRLLWSGITVLRESYVPVRVGEHREQLLAVKRGELAWDDVERWRLELHRQFDDAYSHTRLPARPDYERVNTFLIKARRAALAAELP